MRDETAQKRGPILVIALVIATLAAAFILSGIPWHISKATSTQPYKSDGTTITAQVNTDGSLLVTEQRTFTFTDKVTNIRWKHDSLSSTSKLAMRDLRISILDSNGNAVSSTDLSAVPFQESWRNTNGSDGIGPTEPCYSIDDEYGTVYTYFDAQDATIVYTIDYTIQNGLQVWSDIAELNWTVISSEWLMDSNNVTVTLSLPEPVGVEAKAGENIYAWSHGPQNGTIDASSAAIITYQSPVVKTGQWAFLHIAFPSEWLTNLPNTKEATQYLSQPHLQSTLTSEQSWLDKNASGQLRGNQLDIFMLALCLVILVISLVVFFIRGRDFKPRTTEDAVSTPALEDLHPAIARRLLSWNRESVDDLVNSIMRLKEKGAITCTSKPLGTSSDLVISRKVNPDASDSDPIDEDTLEFLSAVADDVDDNGATPISLASLLKRAESGDKTIRREMINWQKRLTARVKQAKYFDNHSFNWQKILIIAAVILVIAGIALKLGANSNTLLGASLPTAAVMALLANYIPRRTQAGQDLAAQLCVKQPTTKPSVESEIDPIYVALHETLTAIQKNPKDTSNDEAKPQHRSFKLTRKR